MAGLFSTFNVAKRGINVQQGCIDITSHNISNVNTQGYSRQRAEISASRAQTIHGVVGQLGTGAQIDEINRVRDVFLDHQIQFEVGKASQYSVREKVLGELEGVFNEPSDSAVNELMNKFFDSWHQLSNSPELSNTRTVVAQQSLALTDLINHTYNQIQKLQDNSKDLIRSNVNEMNNLLNEIDVINKEIISIKSVGNEPNDLLDKRDELVEKLSSKFPVDVERKEKEAITLNASDFKGVNLISNVDNGENNRFSFINSVEDTKDGNCKVTYYIGGDMATDSNKRTVTIKNVTSEQIRELEEGRVLLTDKNGDIVNSKSNKKSIKDGEETTMEELGFFKAKSGELCGLISIQTDLNIYKDKLNRLAKGLALAVNTIHSGLDTASDKDLFFVNKDNPNGAGEKDITAANITVNKGLLDDVMKIKVSTSNEHGEGEGKRALAIAALRDTMLGVQDINPNIDRAEFIKSNPLDKSSEVTKISNNTKGMTMGSYFKDIISHLGQQSQDATRIVNQQAIVLKGLAQNRESISGVSLDEEMANLIQFRHAYNANAKIISVIDELLDVLINGLKR